MKKIFPFMLLCMVACSKITEPLDPEVQNWIKKNGKGSELINPDMVITWNQAAIKTVNQTQALFSDVPIPPFYESRYYAMVNLAMHDALNAIVPAYQQYALQESADKLADPGAAVAQAAHDVIIDFYGKLNPPAGVTPQPVKDMVEGLLTSSLQSVKPGEAKERGIALGKKAAAAVLAKRTSDGVASSMYPVTEGTTPGAYRFTFPFNGPPFNTPPFAGLYDSPGWGEVKPFAMLTGSQFRAPGPDAVTSAAYAADFNEVKRLGRYNSSFRTADQTQIAKFWAQSSPQAWNDIALQIVKGRSMNAWQVARLLALLQVSEADGYIGAMEGKTHFFYWRPVTAIRLAATDGNPDTEADPDWDVLGWNPAGPPTPPYWPTPPVADYPSAHAVAGGAGAGLLAKFFGKDDLAFSISSASASGARSFSSFSGAARENSLSRIYIGFHFRKAALDGEEQGMKIGQWVFANMLKEK